VVLPPARFISFNDRMREDDGVLASHVARREGVDLRGARTRVARFREGLEERLRRREPVCFGMLGTFRRERGHRLLFEPSGLDFRADSPGLSPVELPVRRREADEVIHAGTGTMRRLFKYGLSAAVIAGIIVISRLEIARPGSGAGTPAAVQPVVVSPAGTEGRAVVERSPVVSPAGDFIPYTPSL
jgi:hypothetical protein